MKKEDVLFLFNLEKNETPSEELDIIINSIVHFSEDEKKILYYEGLKAGHFMAYQSIIEELKNKMEIMK